MNKVIAGGILGGITVFVWGMVSWMFLPFHHQTLSSFAHESLVQEAILASTPQAGVYVLPGMGDPSLSRAEQKALMKQKHAQMEKGPFVFAVVNPTGVGPMAKHMVRGVIIQILGACLITWLLVRSRTKTTYVGRVSFVVLFALGAAILSVLPNWNWWGFPVSYTALEIADLVIAWFLAGLVIAKVTEKT